MNRFLKPKLTAAAPMPPSETASLGETDRMLCLTLDIGEHMLRCGGEIHRIEDTMERICRASTDRGEKAKNKKAGGNAFVRGRFCHIPTSFCIS